MNLSSVSVRVLEPCYLSLGIYFIWIYHYQLHLWGPITFLVTLYYQTTILRNFTRLTNIETRDHLGTKGSKYFVLFVQGLSEIQLCHNYSFACNILSKTNCICIFMKSTCNSLLQLDKLKFRESDLSCKYCYNTAACSLQMWVFQSQLQ